MNFIGHITHYKCQVSLEETRFYNSIYPYTLRIKRYIFYLSMGLRKML